MWFKQEAERSNGECNGKMSMIQTSAITESSFWVIDAVLYPVATVHLHGPLMNIMNESTDRFLSGRARDRSMITTGVCFFGLPTSLRNKNITQMSNLTSPNI